MSFLAAESEIGLNMLRFVPVNETLVVSPLSVIFALVMVRAGAKGNTKSQIDNLISKVWCTSDDPYCRQRRQAFHQLTHSFATDSAALASASDHEIEEYYAKLLRQIQNASHGVKSRIANSFFLNNQFDVENSYKHTVVEKFGAKVQALNFEKADESAKVVNDFVSSTTDGKIKNIVTADAFGDAYSLLVNAIYFTAEWQHKFYKTSNLMGDFFSANGVKREVEFMNEFEETRLYTEDKNVQVLSLQYVDESYVLNILLPKSRFGLSDLRTKLNGEKIQELLSSVKPTYISLTIPKMKIETDFKLKDALIQMGVRDVFSDSANLSGVAKDPPLKVSDAAQKAIIEVDEEGTTAAATTFFKVVPMSARMDQPKRFLADHPFLYILTKDGSPLFMGQFV